MKFFLLGINAIYITQAMPFDIEKMIAALDAQQNRQSDIFDAQDRLIQTQMNLSQQDRYQGWKDQEALWRADPGHWTDMIINVTHDNMKDYELPSYSDIIDNFKIFD